MNHLFGLLDPSVGVLAGYCSHNMHVIQKRRRLIPSILICNEDKEFSVANLMIQ